MQSVTIKTSDGVIWEKTNVTLELINAMSRGPVAVNLLHEGPCCESSGLNELLNLVVNYTGADESSVIIFTSNQVQSSKFKEIRQGFVELDLAKKIAISKSNVTSTLKKRFGLFVGRSNWIRLGLASHLYNNYADTTNMTFHYDPANDFFKDNFGLEMLVTKNWNQLPEVVEFLKHVPIRLESQTYPILWNVNAFQLDDLYKDIFCEIVCETYFTGNVFFFTEKLMRCILNRRPFIVQGPRYFLENLKSLGFKTFDRWWDEGYINDSPDGTLNSIKQNIDWIAEQSDFTIQVWYQEMQSVLDHNFETLKNLNNQTILTTNFKS